MGQPGVKKRKKTSRQNSYIGKAGHLTVMAEFALRGYNVSLPEIDNGDDVYLVNEVTGKLWRIQVKGATPQKSGSYQVLILESQITKEPAAGAPDLHFVLALRHLDRWRFIVVSRHRLKKYIDDRAAVGKDFGYVHGKKKKRRTLSITFRKGEVEKVTCSGVQWKDHLSDWSEWPHIDHEAAFVQQQEYATDTTNDNTILHAAEASSVA